MASLKDKRIVVLGGTSGLGFATAQAAGAEGAQLVVASGRQARVDRAVSLLPAGTTGHVCDFTDEAQIKDLFGHIGAFDHLVYTAGELRQFLLEAGFSKVELFGGYDARPLGINTPAVIRATV